MPIAHSPHAPVDISKPSPWGTCDRCGAQYLLNALNSQHQWSGNALINLHLRVCPTCLDVPAEFLRTVVIGPDPVPVKDPRPGYQNSQQGTTVAVNIVQLIGDL